MTTPTSRRRPGGEAVAMREAAAKVADGMKPYHFHFETAAAIRALPLPAGAEARAALSTGGEPSGFVEMHGYSSDPVKLRRLLQERDQFIIDRGLWSDFVDTLGDQPLSTGGWNSDMEKAGVRTIGLGEGRVVIAHGTHDGWPGILFAPTDGNEAHEVGGDASGQHDWTTPPLGSVMLLFKTPASVLAHLDRIKMMIEAIEAAKLPEPPPGE